MTLLSLTDDRQLGLAEKNWPAMQTWARQHGWTFIAEEAPRRENPYFIKWDWLARYASGEEVYLWLDVDCEVRHPENQLPNFPDLAFSQDFGGLCCGAFAGTGRYVRALAKIMLNLGVLHAGRTGEQDRVKTLCPGIDLFPESFIANPRTAPGVRHNATVLHHWANQKIPPPFLPTP